jgi:ABC-2 type transport system ATP-binding protein
MESELSLEIHARPLLPDVVDGLSLWSHNVRQDGDRISLTLPGEAQIPEINRYLVGQGVDVFALRPQRVSLEDLFIEIVGVDGGL